MSMRPALLLIGTTLVALAAALLALGGNSEAGWLAFTLGLGVVGLSLLPWHLATSNAIANVMIGAVLVGFAGAQSLRLFALDRVEASELIALLAEVVIIGVALLLVRAQLHGIGLLVALLAQPDDAGYARLLPSREAIRVVDAELARSRRREEPLTCVALEAQTVSVNAFPVSYRELRFGTTRFLEAVYVRARLAHMLTQHARRSDVVVQASNGTCFVVSPGTETSGALAFAHRVVGAAESELGVCARFGLSSFPTDGECLADLMAVASTRVRGVVDPVEIDDATIARPSEPVSALSTR